MSSHEHLLFLEKITRRLSEAFQEVHQLCLSELEKAVVPDQPLDEIQEIEVPPIIQVDIDSAEEPQKESKTKKIKKEGEDRECEESRSRKKVKKVSHKPKAPASSFLMFFKQQQANIAKTYPSYGVTELTKVAAKCWNELSTQEKEPYIRHCEQERKIYQQKMEKYRIDFPHEIAEKQKEKGRKQPKKDKKGLKQTPRKEKPQLEQNNEPAQGNGYMLQEEQISDSDNNEDGNDSLGIV